MAMWPEIFRRWSLPKTSYTYIQRDLQYSNRMILHTTNGWFSLLQQYSHFISYFPVTWPIVGRTISLEGLSSSASPWYLKLVTPKFLRHEPTKSHVNNIRYFQHVRRCLGTATFKSNFISRYASYRTIFSLTWQWSILSLLYRPQAFPRGHYNICFWLTIDEWYWLKRGYFSIYNTQVEIHQNQLSPQKSPMEWLLHAQHWWC